MRRMSYPFYFIRGRNINLPCANKVDPNQTPRFWASDLGLAICLCPAYRRLGMNWLELAFGCIRIYFPFLNTLIWLHLAILSEDWPRGCKTSFMLNSIEREISPTHKC